MLNLGTITVGKIETHDREVSRTAVKGRTVTSVKNCKSQDPERALHTVTGETPDFTWASTSLPKYLPSPSMS